MTDKEVMQDALDALESLQAWPETPENFKRFRAIEALRARLAQPEQEPVAWADKVDIDRDGHDLWVSRQKPAKDGVPLYTAPPQREWVGLTDGEREQIEIKANDKSEMTAWEYAHRVGNFTEAKLKEKNNG